MSAYEVPFPFEPMSYNQALTALGSIKRLGISPMLETVVDMLADLGNPQEHMRIIQIGGTNGKTSTSRFVAALLRVAGMQTALYTSPELVSYTERLELDGAPVAEDLFGRGIAAAIAAGARVNARRQAAGLAPYDVTEFDTLTVAALVICAWQKVQVAVLEVGMGGRWDATTATAPEVTCITGIGLDHTHILGDTLAAIAAEKAAIIKPHQRVVLGAGTAEPEVQPVMLERARAAGVTPVLVRPAGAQPPAGYSTTTFSYTFAAAAHGQDLVVTVQTPRATYPLLALHKPSYQAQNVAAAITVAEAFLNRALNLDTLSQTLAATPTPGRFDVLNREPFQMIDAAHNPQSIVTFLTSLAELMPHKDQRPMLLVAALADKDTHGMAALLAHEFPRAVVTQTQSPRALPAPELAHLMQEAGANVAAIYPTVPEALAALDGRPFIAVGSITLAGEVAESLRPCAPHAHKLA